MKTVIVILFILVILICGILMTITAVIKYEIEKYRNYITNKTKFVCKESPDITCTIDYIYWDDIENNRMSINVTYPEGYTSNLLTTIGVFNDIWEEKLDE